MANLRDYIEWRGDIPFEVDPFNEVDNVLLSELAYTDFDGVVPEEKEKAISIGEANRRFFELHTEEEIMQSVMHVKVAPLFMGPMAESKRFSKIKLCSYVNEIDAETQVQFSAVTYILPDNTYYVAYRGTDNTIVGWKEDFNMSFLYETPGQKRAVQYLNEHFIRCRKPIRVGGHSKGGNFAIFAAAFCIEPIRKRIVTVYSNDGPGFRDEVLQAEGYKTILPKIVSLAPEQTLVSLIQGNMVDTKFVKSSEKNINQHDCTTWQISRNHFEYADKSERSEVIDESFSEWLEDISDDDREKFVDILFDVITAGGTNTTDEFVAGGLKNVSDVMKRIKELPADEKDLMTGLIDKLRENIEAKAYQHVVTSFKEKIMSRIGMSSKSDDPTETT